MGFLIGGRGMLLMGARYFFRDLFTDSRAAGSVLNQPCVPGPGTITGADTENKLAIAGGRLRCAGGKTSPAWSDPGVRLTPTIERAAGRFMMARMAVDAVTTVCEVGFDTSSAGEMDAHAFEITTGGGTVKCRNNAASGPVFATYAAGTSYKFIVALMSTGAAFFMQGGAYTYPALIAIRRAGTTATLYAGFANFNAAFNLDEIFCPDVALSLPIIASDGFGSAFGSTDGLGHADGVAGGKGAGGAGESWNQRLGTWTVTAGTANAATLSGGAAIATLDAGTVDHVAAVKITRTGGESGLILRYIDNDNYIRVIHNGTQVLVIRRIAGSESTAQTTSATYAAGAYLEAYVDGTSFRLFYNSLAQGSSALTINDVALQTGTAAGIYTTDAANTFDDFEMRARGTGNEYSIFNNYIGAEPALALSAPTAYQTFQRSGATGTISIAGSIANATDDVEASFNGGAYATIATGATGAFSGTLTEQAQGQGTLTVRLKNNTSIVATVSNVGVGDVFIVAGQSNASGRGTNNQTYSHASLLASRFHNNYTWGDLVDPTDSNSGQPDSVSQDGDAAGSVWPLVATLLMADQSVPVAFVPCAKGGTSITEWQPGANHVDRATLYGSMNYRAFLTGAKAVLWWQGETDGVDGMSQATYNSNLDSLANAIQADRGIKLVVAKLQDCTGIADANENAIRAAVADAWADNDNVVAGPDLSGLTSDDAYHIMTDVNLSAAADLWWAAIESEFYP